MKFYLGTTSKLKLSAVEEVLKNYVTDYEILAFNSPSGVPITPWNEEIIKGARNRAENLRKKFLDNDGVYVGLESGLVERFGSVYEETWCVIIFREKEFSAYSSGLRLPSEIVEKIRQGIPHSDIMDEISRKFNSSPKDTWGLYTRFKLTRKCEIKEAFRNALVMMLTCEQASII
jgi:non-canonical (house-cleaning) NTP pyrophosphatase